MAGLYFGVVWFSNNFCQMLQEFVVDVMVNIILASMDTYNDCDVAV